LFKALDAEFHFVIDLAADETNHLCPRYFTAGDDALRQAWPRADEGWCWLNPPFSRLPGFSAEAASQHKHGSNVVMLVPAHRVEQAWWHTNVLGVASEIRFPRGRVEYVPPPGVRSSGPAFPSVIVVYRWPVTFETRAVSWSPRLFADQEDAL
jgi:site-specific DNA-methyltransferase (adenine-specific)